MPKLSLKDHLKTYRLARDAHMAAEKVLREEIRLAILNIFEAEFRTSGIKILRPGKIVGKPANMVPAITLPSPVKDPDDDEVYTELSWIGFHTGFSFISFDGAPVPWLLAFLATAGKNKRGSV